VGLTDLMPMDFDSLNEIQHNEAVRKRLAKLMTSTPEHTRRRKPATIPM
jgi:hypothetical protein